jgi:uncharacterized protein (TIGR03437 family)
MKRAKWLILLMLLACGGAWAQPVTSVNISLSVNGPIFIVDGQQYDTPQTFLWPEGSKHSLQFLLSVDDATLTTLPYQAGNGDLVRWTFNAWSYNLPSLTPATDVNQTITATPGLTSIVGSVTTQYLIDLVFTTVQGGINLANCGAPGNAPQNAVFYGIVYIDGACYGNSAEIWTTDGVHQLNAFPYPGYDFVGWTVDGGAPNAFLSSFTLALSTELIPIFQPGKRVEFRTSPLGLQVVVDHSVITTPPALPSSIPPITNISTNCTPNYAAIPGTAPPGLTPLCVGDFDFLPASVHQIAAPTPQIDGSGNYWVFSGFNDGLTQNSNYVTNNVINQPDLVIANFIPGVKTSILTVPGGLSIQIDGRSNWQTTTFVWGQGETHTLSAPLTQVDSQGRTWQFVSWSNKGSASQSIVVPAGVQGLVFSATYQEQGQVQVNSTPAGLSFTAGGSACTTPCVLNQPSGTQISIVVPPSIPNTPTSRYDFSSWSSGGSSTVMQVTFTSGVQVFTANYNSSYLLTTTASPAAAATFTLSPGSPDGFFPSGTSVAVTAVPKAGYKFTQWTGDASGSNSTAYLTMSVPHSVTALLTSAPTIAPAGILNAAGPTPDGSVAAGSFISIYGQNLSADTVIGPASPLKQTLDNVTVTANGYLFPLWFVSPLQINAQVPWELTPGTYTLTVQSPGQPNVTGQFTVSRNAPGVYTQPNAQNLPLALAVHQDYSLITPSSPARRNEIISIYANGLGPFSESVPDGYPAPLSPLWTMADPISVIVGGSLTLAPYWSGAAPEMVATSIVQLQIVNSIPSATTVNLVITANGKPSAVVQLPVQ